MGWQANHGPWPGEAPGQGNGLPGPPPGFQHGGFQHGGAWEVAAPSAALAAALEAAAGPDGLYQGADVDALVGIARHWAAVESWAAAGLLAALRAMVREDGEGTPLLRRRADLPDGWDDSLNYEIAAALAMGPVSAGNLAALAWTLGTRLPGIGRLLANGTLTKAKAKLIVAVFEPLDDQEATRAEALILPEVPGKTYYQVERLAWRAALAVAPDVAERRRKQAEQERARVTVFREESGTVGLSGRDLPAAQALAGHANVVARAKEYAVSGAFPGATQSRLEALGYLHLLNGVTAADAIAFARTAATEPPVSTQHDEAGGGAAVAASDAGRDHRGSEDPGGDGEWPDDNGGEPGGGSGPYGGGNPHGGGLDGGGLDGGGGRPVGLPEVTVPLATLLGVAERAGENRLLGPLDPALARDFAAAAARSPGSRWEVTVVDEHGYAVGHGVARPRRGKRRRPQPPDTGSSSTRCCALPARVNITVTEAFHRELATLRELAAQAPPPDEWSLAQRAPTAEYGTWVLTVPGGQQLTVSFDVVPTHACDHKYQVSSYQPSGRLRRLVQVRDRDLLTELTSAG